MPAMNIVALLLLASLFLVSTVRSYADDDFEEEQDFVHPSSVNVEEARKEYDHLVTYSKLPNYGSCWSAALDDLHSNCRALSEDAQTRLAVKFANCLLEKSREKTVPCGAQDDTGACIQQSKLVSTEFFASYVHFFTHTQNICFYLASEEWQRRAETQVNRLMDASQSVSLQLEQSKTAIMDTQSQILDSQKTALVSSEALVLHNEKLNESLTASQMALIANFRELQRSASETRMWIGDIGDRISRLQSVFIDEFTGFYSLIFYLVSGIGCFVLTSTMRTAGARLWLFLLLIVTFFGERFRSQQQLASLEKEPGGMPDSAFVTQFLSDEAWLIRRGFWAVAAAVLVYFGYKYEDVNLSNQRLIMGLHKEILQIRGVMDSLNKKAVMSRDQRGISVLDGQRRRDDGSLEPNSHSSVSVPDKIRDYVERFRRSMTPSFQEERPEPITPHGNLATVPEDEEDLSRSESEGGTSPRRDRRSREVTPLSLDRLTPGRVLRSSMPRESPARSPSVAKSVSSVRIMGRRGIHMREPTPEQTRSGLLHLSDITNRAKEQLQEVLNRNGVEEQEE